MTGEKNLEELLRSMAPVLREGEFVFCTMKGASYGDYSYTGPIASFQEEEGLTLVIPRSNADQAELPYDGLFKCITLGVHSSLQAVGLTAAVAGILANDGIAANVIAGYFHDHIFVQAGLANRAIGLLLENSTGNVATNRDQ